MRMSMAGCYSSPGSPLRVRHEDPYGMVKYSWIHTVVWHGILHKLFGEVARHPSARPLLNL